MNLWRIGSATLAVAVQHNFELYIIIIATVVVVVYDIDLILYKTL